jgi:hypothetical protein
VLALTYPPARSRPPRTSATAHGGLPRGRRYRPGGVGRRAGRRRRRAGQRGTAGGGAGPRQRGADRVGGPQPGAADLLQTVVPDLADWAATYQLDEDGGLRLVDVRHADRRRRDATRAAAALLQASTADGAGIGAVARAARTAHYPDLCPEVLAVFTDDPHAQRQLAGLAVSAMLVILLAVGGRVLATLTLGRIGGSFAPAEVVLAEQIAERAAISLHNSQLYQRKRAAVLTLQRSLLPAALPDVPGLRVAARYLTGTVGTEVGGDFYDVIPLDRGRTGLAIGDVPSTTRPPGNW